MRPDAQIRGLLDGGQDLVAIDRVKLDLRKLLIGQLAILIDHGIRHANLTHIMEQPGKIHLFAFFCGFACLPRNLGGILRHPGRVAVRILVFRIDGRRQSLGGLLKQRMFPFLPFLVELDLQIPCMRHLAAQIPQREYI